MFEIARTRGIGHIDDRGTIRLDVAVLGIHGSPPVMTDVSDPAIALFVNDWLIRRTRLQVVKAYKPHIFRLGRAADSEY